MTYPPQNLDAERALLACLLMGSGQVDDVANMLQGRDFYEPRNEAVYEACLRMLQTGARVDPVTLPVPATARPYVVDLVADQQHVHPASAMAYAEQVVDAALRRRLQEAGTATIQLAQTAEDAGTAASEAERLVTEAAMQARTTEGGVTVADGIDAAIDWLENPSTGAPTPWVDVNDKSNGLLPGSMVTVAARPGHGKSLLLKDVALFTARQGMPVHIATLEMSRNEYMARILCGLAKVPLSNMLKRDMSDGEWTRVGEAAGVARNTPMYLDDRPGQSMAQIRAAARQTARRFGGTLGLIGIDYAQLVRPQDTRLPREQQVAQISRDTKLLAKEFECPVLLLAQLSRKNTDRPDKTPLPSDLRESGALEQDSDQVWLLHRPDQYGDEQRLGEVDLIIGKNRNGPAPVTLPLAFQGHYARIASLA